ncbi:hypothetical protein FOZ63_020767, partial [Perkinsus olseni]
DIFSGILKGTACGDKQPSHTLITTTIRPPPYFHLDEDFDPLTIKSLSDVRERDENEEAKTRQERKRRILETGPPKIDELTRRDQVPVPIKIAPTPESGARTHNRRGSDTLQRRQHWVTPKWRDAQAKRRADTR